MAFGVCGSNCQHGGCCVLDTGHAGDHDSNYCQWTDAEALSDIESDALITAHGWGWLAELQRALESLDGA